jgi:hypothetical protein
MSPAGRDRPVSIPDTVQKYARGFDTPGLDIQGAFVGGNSADKREQPLLRCNNRPVDL